VRIPQDSKISIGGTTVGSVESWEMSFNRNLESFKGIEDDTDKRKPSRLIEKNYDVSFNATINIEDSTAYEETLGGSNPYGIEDDRSDQNITVTVDTSAGSDILTVTDARFEEVSADMSNDSEKRTASLTGVAKTWDVDGDL